MHRVKARELKCTTCPAHGVCLLGGRVTFLNLVLTVLFSILTLLTTLTMRFVSKDPIHPDSVGSAEHRSMDDRLATELDVQAFAGARPADVLCPHRRTLWTATGRRECPSDQRLGVSISYSPIRLVELILIDPPRIPDISLDNPLQKPYHIPLIEPPPDVPELSERLPASVVPDQHFERALLRSLGYVLDVEGDTRYPTDVDVLYSYRSTPFDHAQFVHSSGSAFVQIVGGADGFLFLNNRLYLSHRPSPQAFAADSLRAELEEFCRDKERLKGFWEDVIAELPAVVGAAEADSGQTVSG
jgi:hypothetical protein